MSENDEINLPVDAFEPNRERVTIDAGAFVQQGNTVYRIAQVLDFESIIGIAVETGRSTPLAVAELRPVATDKESAAAPELTEIADPDWREAERRFAAIQPLLGRYMVGQPGREDSVRSERLPRLCLGRARQARAVDVKKPRQENPVRGLS